LPPWWPSPRARGGRGEVGEEEADPPDAVEAERVGEEEEESGPSTEARRRPAPETRPASHPLDGGGGGGGGGEAPPDGDGCGSPPAAGDSIGGRTRKRAEAEGRWELKWRPENKPGRRFRGRTLVYVASLGGAV
jgi:hypothetical protein